MSALIPSRFQSALLLLGPVLLPLLLPLLLGCGPGDAPTRPNVILISVDTLRFDHLGSSGYEYPNSPFLDSLAAHGVVFEQALAQASWTLPSHMSLMTSTYPHTHQVENDNRTLPRSLTTLGEVFRRGGYATIGFVSWIYVSARYGFGRGFEQYEELVPEPGPDGKRERSVVQAGPFVDRVVDWADQLGDRRPYFLFLHLFDPHMSYEPPLEHVRALDPPLTDTRAGDYQLLKRYIKGLNQQPASVPPALLEQARALYDGEIRYVDEQLKRLFGRLEALGLLENSLVVLTSDHGEEFSEHGSMEGHQWTLYDEVLRVPLLVLLPDRTRAGTRVSELVQLIDVAPTLLEATGLARPRTFEGQSLWSLLLGASRGRPGSGLAYAAIQRFNQKYSLRTPTHKLIFTRDTGTNRLGVPLRAGFELYDLEQDPGEQTNVFGTGLAVEARLQERLRKFMELSRPPLNVERPDLSADELERMRALGYTGR